MNIAARQPCRADRVAVNRRDGELERNAIYRLDKSTGELTRLRWTGEASNFATGFGDVKLISTVVEPSAVNRGREAVLYASRDGADWTPVLRQAKDWPPAIFQFGTIVLPTSHYGAAQGIISGQAISGLDDRVAFVDFQGDSRPEG